MLLSSCSALRKGVKSRERRSVRRAFEGARENDHPPTDAQSSRRHGGGGRVLARWGPWGNGAGAVQKERLPVSDGLRVLLVLLSARYRTLRLPSRCPDLPQAARPADRAMRVLRPRPAARSRHVRVSVCRLRAGGGLSRAGLRIRLFLRGERRGYSRLREWRVRGLRRAGM
jgi:hypothetical protein